MLLIFLMVQLWWKCNIHAHKCDYFANVLHFLLKINESRETFNCTWVVGKGLQSLSVVKAALFKHLHNIVCDGVDFFLRRMKCQNQLKKMSYYQCCYALTLPDSSSPSHVCPHWSCMKVISYQTF